MREWKRMLGSHVCQRGLKLQRPFPTLLWAHLFAQLNASEVMTKSECMCVCPVIPWQSAHSSLLSLDNNSSPAHSVISLPLHLTPRPGRGSVSPASAINFYVSTLFSSRPFLFNGSGRVFPLNGHLIPLLYPRWAVCLCLITEHAALDVHWRPL